MSKKTSDKVLRNLRRRMETLERLLHSLNDPPPGQLRGTINRIAVEGRSVTNILQNLRHVAPDFDSWYEPYRKEMLEDELMKFFYDLRSKTLKEGEDKISGIALSFAGPGGILSRDNGLLCVLRNPDGTLTQVFYPKPPNATSTFIGDSEGGSGWVVKNPDGTEPKVYIKIPGGLLDISLLFLDPPKSHLGKPVENTLAQNLCALYVTYLRKMVKDAEKQFGSNTLQ